jgi:guanylate kinase
MADESTPKGKLVVFSAPSGTGKSTVAHHVLEQIGSLEFSVSATTRGMRPGEKDGVDYFFLSRESFEKKIHEGGFIEYEFFFGNYYGTLLDKTQQAVDSGRHMLFDLDVKGALNLKRIFGDRSLLIFLKPPSMDVLMQRLEGRHSEGADAVKARIERASMELAHAHRFDEVLVNDDLQKTVDTVVTLIKTFISKP